MERFAVRFLQLVLLLGIVVLLGTLYPLWNLSVIMARAYAHLDYMRVPVFFLAAGMLFSAATALGFGFVATMRYGKDLVFTEKTVNVLENASLAFFAGLLFSVVLILYTCFNITGSITNLLVQMAALVFLILSLIALMLANVVRRGAALQDEQDLTI